MHVSVHGPAAKIYKCAQCPASFVFKSQLINHSFSHQQHHHHQNRSNQIGQSSLGMQNNLNQQQQQNQRFSIGNNQKINQTGYTFNNNRQPPHQFQANSNNNINHHTNMDMNGRVNGLNNSLNSCNNNESLEPLHSHQYIVNDNNADGTKTYTCLTCSKTFNSQRNLSVHVRIHTGFRPFQCNVCQRTFTSNLQNFIKFLSKV
jgi:hypothetical protein